jgi:cell wall-associated NlpC family hydrolase
MPVKGTYLLAAGGGALLLWAGFRGKKWTQAFRDIVSGKNPQTETTAYPIQTAPAAYSAMANQIAGAVPAAGGGSATGQAIASDAMQYEGAPYVWAGAPGTHGVGPWDCSSFCNAVIGRDLGLAIPLYKAGTYHGQSHGPATGIWLVWSGAFTIKGQDEQPGDLVIWLTHMGIVIGPGEYISAYDTQDGVITRAISGGGPPGEPSVIRRLKAVTERG